MKKTNKRITAIAAAAATVFSMTVAMNFTATAAETHSKHDELVDSAKGFNIDSSTFTEKYTTAKNRLNTNRNSFDFIDNENNKGLGFEDYDALRNGINSLYASSLTSDFAGYTANDLKNVKPFSKKSFSYTQGYSSNGKSYDVDGDNVLSFYDYCCLLRYLQEEIGITDEYTDFTVEDLTTNPQKKSYKNDVLELNDGEAYITLKKVVSGKEKITVPTEICCKIGHKGLDGKLIKDDNGNVIYSWHIIPVMEIAENTFSECTNANEITIKNYVQPEWFNMIQGLDEEFEIIGTKKKVTATTFVDIADNAFAGCENLEKINFPTHVNFSIDAFNGTEFAKAKYNNIYPEKGVIYAKSSDGKALVACGTYDPNLAFGYKNDMYYFDLSENTTTITNKLKNALNSIYNQVDYSLTIPEKVEYIHDDAFSGCKNLTYVNFKEYENFAKDDNVKELIRKSNCAFSSTQFIANTAKKEIDAATKTINSKEYNNEMEKVEAVCRYIFDNATYRDYHAIAEQFDLFPNGTFNTLDESRGNVYATANVFLSNYTECESFAKAVALLLDKVGVENFFTGTKSTAGGYGHAYNHVYIDGKWYEIDMSGYGHFRSDYAKYKADCEKNGRSTNFVKDSVGKNVTIGGRDEFAVFGDDKQLPGSAYDIYDFTPDRSKVRVVVPVGESVPAKFNNAAYEAATDICLVVDNRVKYIDSNRKYAKNKTVNGMYFDANGNYQHEIGWYELKGDWYYFNKKGVLARNEEVEAEWGGKKGTFKFGDDCINIVGWSEKDKTNYYYDMYEGKLKNIILKWGENYYYFNSEGALIVNNNISWNGYNFYANSNGELNVKSVLTQEDALNAFEAIIKK